MIKKLIETHQRRKARKIYEIRVERYYKGLEILKQLKAIKQDLLKD